MDRLLPLLFSGSAGLMVGILYYLGLAYTLRLLPKAKNAPLVFTTSMILRIAITVAVFFLLTRGGHRDRFIAALSGFLIIRVFYLFFTRRAK